MPRRDALLLKTASVWTLFIWTVFVVNLFDGSNDRSLGFKLVHLVLAIISIAFALAIWVVASRSSRRSERVG